jgi:hypothetical protein
VISQQARETGEVAVAGHQRAPAGQLTDPRPLRWLVLALGQPGLWELAPEVADGVTRLQADEPVRAPR